MSDLIRTTNLIKTRRTVAWLSPSQQEAMIALQEQLRIPGAVNLFGSVGVGKTFLGWAVADELDYSYFPHVSYLKPRADRAGAVIDNCQSDRSSHRSLLKTLSFLGIRYAVLITRRMIDDYVHYVELTLTQADQVHVRGNLASEGFFCRNDQTPHLWYLVNPSL